MNWMIPPAHASRISEETDSQVAEAQNQKAYLLPQQGTEG